MLDMRQCFKAQNPFGNVRNKTNELSLAAYSHLQATRLIAEVQLTELQDRHCNNHSRRFCLMQNLFYATKGTMGWRLDVDALFAYRFKRQATC